MPSALPEGEPAPADGSLPRRSLAGQAIPALRRLRPRAVLRDPLRLLRLQHLHRDRARRRGRPGRLRRHACAPRSPWQQGFSVTDRRPRRCSSAAARRPCCRPPTWSGPSQLVRDTLGLAADAEVTTEANPESVDQAYLAELRAGGFTRVSLGMQSARAARAARCSSAGTRRAGRSRRWPRRARRGLRARQPRPDLRHAGRDRRRLAGLARLGDRRRAGPRQRVRPHRRGRHPARRPGAPRRDADARRRRARRPLPDRRRAAEPAGLHWYEVSNWASSDAARCRHNELYWRSADWWGFGPGAHSHVGGVRWWNVKHPSAYAARLAAGESPAAARELLADEDRRVERVLLETRLVDGLDPAVLTAAGRKAVRLCQDDGLLEAGRRPAGADPARPPARRRRRPRAPPD